MELRVDVSVVHYIHREEPQQANMQVSISI